MQLLDLFDEIPLANSDVVPLALQQLLRTQLNVIEDWTRAEQLLLDTQRMLPDRLEIQVALYKMYAYSNRFDESLVMINEVMDRAASDGGFPADWRQLDNGSATWSGAKGPIRFYLYSMKALGFVLLRKGDVVNAYEVLRKLCELDPTDQVGSSVVCDIAERLVEDDEEYVA